VSQSTAVLFLTHVWNRVINLKYERLRSEIGTRADVFVLAEPSPSLLAALAVDPPATAPLGFAVPRLVETLGYPTLEEGMLVPGSTHFPLLAFAAARRTYDAFLVVEFDVEFSGNWGALLDTIIASGTDFASMHLRTRAQVPDWYHWASFEPPDADREWASDLEQQRRAFSPIYFIRRGALEFVDAAHRRGWRGHYECLMPTIIAHHGCTMLDLAEGERFCRGTDQNWAEDQPDGALSTVRWRPPITVEEFRERSTGNTLFHPIKGIWFYDGTRLLKPAPDQQG
jgi:hypothetical protein